MALTDDAKELKGLLGEIQAAMNGVADNTKAIGDGFGTSKEALEGLVSVAQTFQQDTSKLTQEEAAALKNKIDKNKELLSLSQQSLKDQIANNVKKREATSSLIESLNKQKESLSTSQKDEKQKQKINKQLAYQNSQYQKISQSISNQIQTQNQVNKVLEDAEGTIEDMSEELDKMANPSRLSKFGKHLKKPIEEGLDIAKLLPGPFGVLFGLVMKADQAISKMGKNLNMGHDAARNLNEEFTSFANQSRDPAINQERMTAATTELNMAMGTTHKISNEQLGTMIKLNKYSDISYQDQAKMLKTSKALGETYDGYVNTMMGTIKAQKFNNNLSLNAKKIMLDVNNASDRTKISISGGSDGLAKAAVEAAKLGTNLDGVAGIADSLLDFESSIANEMEAELLTGKDLNLERARSAALNNDFATVAKEINAQLGSAAEFGEMNRIQQEAMAKAVGMTADQLGTMLIEQEAIKSVGGDLNDDQKAAFEERKKAIGAEAAAKELQKEGIENLMKEKSLADEKADAEEKFQNAIGGLAAAFIPFFEMLLMVSNVIMPALVMAVEPFRLAIEMVNGLFTGSLESLSGMEIAIGAITTAVIGLISYQKISKGIDIAKIAYQKQQKAAEIATGAVKNAQTVKDKASATISIIKGAWSSLGVIPFVGAGLAIAAIAGGIAYLMSSSSKANDMVSPGGGGGGYGSRTLFGPEGAIQLNNKDTVIAGTNLFGDDTVSEPGKPTEFSKEGEIQSKPIKGGSSMAGVVSAVNALGARLDALASRPINVQVGEDVIIKAAIGNDPKVTGDEMGKNSYQLN